MSKFLSSIIFSIFLLFQTTSLAEESSDAPQETAAEDQGVEVPEMEAVPETTAPEPEESDGISEIQREAEAAEAAELREAVEEESTVE